MTFNVASQNRTKIYDMKFNFRGLRDYILNNLTDDENQRKTRKFTENRCLDYIDLTFYFY